MYNFIEKYQVYFIIWIAILLLLLLFYIYILILDRKLIKLENKLKKDFRNRLDFIPILYDMTEWKIKMHKKMFEKILEHRRLWLFSYEEMKFDHIIWNELIIHKELIFLFKVINKLEWLKTEKDYKYIENFFDKNSQKIAENIYIYKVYSKVLNRLIKIKNFTLFWLLIKVNYRNFLIA
jgi:hypothetical protein